ncbi:hypothetical protein STEG23_009261, partial [Scotinomys teguina]
CSGEVPEKQNAQQEVLRPTQVKLRSYLAFRPSSFPEQLIIKEVFAYPGGVKRRTRFLRKITLWPERRKKGALSFSSMVYIMNLTDPVIERNSSI